MPRTITAFSNATVKRLRSLRDKKARRAEGLFLAEGLRILTEARDSGLLPEIVAFSAEGAKHPLAAEIIEAAEAAGGEAIETSPDILSKMSGKDNPQMLLGAYRQPATSLDRIDRSAAPLWIVAQALRDPGNIGTILRTGDAVGAAETLATYHPRVAVALENAKDRLGYADEIIQILQRASDDYSYSCGVCTNPVRGGQILPEILHFETH